MNVDFYWLDGTSRVTGGDFQTRSLLKKVHIANIGSQDGGANPRKSCENRTSTSPLQLGLRLRGRHDGVQLHRQCHIALHLDFSLHERLLRVQLAFSQRHKVVIGHCDHDVRLIRGLVCNRT
jgi:hypothetical protein